MAAGKGSFSSSYIAGMGALALLAALAGLTLTGEGHSGLVGSIEVVALVGAAVLFVAAGVGARTTPGSSWPVLAAVAAVVLVGVLAFLTATGPDAGSAVLFEIAAVVIGVLLVGVLRKA